MLTGKANKMAMTAYIICGMIEKAVEQSIDDAFVVVRPFFSAFSHRFPVRESVVSANIVGVDGEIYKPIVAVMPYVRLAEANIAILCKMLRIAYTTLAIEGTFIDNGIDVDHCSSITVCKDGSVLVHRNREMLVIGVDGDLTNWYSDCYESGRAMVTKNARQYCDMCAKRNCTPPASQRHRMILNRYVTMVEDDTEGVSLYHNDLRVSPAFGSATAFEIAIVADAFITNRREEKHANKLKGIEASLLNKFYMDVSA